MGIRTSPIAVQAVLLPGGDYDLNNKPDLTPFIEIASGITDWVVNYAATTAFPLTLSQAEIVERWLSAHFYVQSDQPYTSRSTGGQSGSFQGGTGNGIENSKYGLAAIKADWSGGLTILDKRQFADCVYLGPRRKSVGELPAG